MRHQLAGDDVPMSDGLHSSQKINKVPRMPTDVISCSDTTKYPPHMCIGELRATRIIRDEIRKVRMYSIQGLKYWQQCFPPGALMPETCGRVQLVRWHQRRLSTPSRTHTQVHPSGEAVISSLPLYHNHVLAPSSRPCYTPTS